MSEPSPIPCVWTGEVFKPLPPFQRVATAHYGPGEIVSLVPHEERSAKSHRHYFAMVKEAWQNLPEDQAERFPTAEHLRKWALIKAGYCNQQQVPCASRAEALRWAAIAAANVPYSVALPTGNVVTIYTPQSQSLRAMGKAKFQTSKDAVLQIVSDMIAVQPAQLAERARHAA